MSFTLVVLLELLVVYAIRKNYGAAWFSNMYLFAAVLGSLLLQLAVIYTPVRTIFRTAPLGGAEWTVVAVVCAAFFVLVLAAEKIIRFAAREKA